LYLSIRRAIKQIAVVIGHIILPTLYKILSKILFTGLTPYSVEIIEDHECGFQHNGSTTDHIFCIHQILERKWE
jgi:hypothetical protein